MAIQLRRGAYENYDASKLKPAEVGVVQSGDPNTTDGKAVYIAINTNDVKRIPTADEMVDHNAEAEGIYENIVAQNQTASQLFQNTSTKAAEAEQSASTASSASASANSSMQRAETAADLLTNVTATAQTLETGQQATASYNNGVFSFGLPKGDTGNTGAKGDKGDTGATPNLSVGTVTTLEPGSDATVEITGTAEAPVLNMGIPRGNTGEVSAEQFYKAFVTDTATGAIAHFTDGADSIPMKDVLVHIEPVQEGSGDPSPDNVRPITGWTGAKVTRAGKNLINTEDFTLVKDNHRTIGKYMHVPCPMNIVFSVNVVTNTATDVVTLSLRDIQGPKYTPLGQLSIPAGTTGVFQTTLTLTTLSLGYLYCYMDMNDNDNATITITNIQIEVGSTATDYEPYSGDQISVTFPTEAGTVYGGTLDVTTGELVVDRAQIASYNGEALPSTWISDRDVYASGTTPTIGAQVVYKLATPITYTLTPQEITSLLGENNLWADTGDSEVEYRADTKMYITKKITEAVSALS